MKNIMLVVLAGLFATSASAGVIYSNDFSTNDTDGWSGGSIVNERYQQDTTDSNVKFRLKDDYINNLFNISFDVFTFSTFKNGNDTWESSGDYKDIFVVVDIIKNTFQGEKNDIRLFRGTLDDGYNSFSFSDVPAFKEDQLRITFRSNVSGKGLEFFAIDNVKVTTAVSEPASLALLGLGLIGLAAARRRNI